MCVFIHTSLPCTSFCHLWLVSLLLCSWMLLFNNHLLPNTHPLPLFLLSSLRVTFPILFSGTLIRHRCLFPRSYSSPNPCCHFFPPPCFPPLLFIIHRHYFIFPPSSSSSTLLHTQSTRFAPSFMFIWVLLFMYSCFPRCFVYCPSIFVIPSPSPHSSPSSLLRSLLL